MAKHSRMKVLLAVGLLSLHIVSSTPHKSNHDSDLEDNNVDASEQVLSRQTRDSHHLSRPSTTLDHHRPSRSRSSGSQRPSRAFRQTPSSVPAQNNGQSQPPAERRTFITVLLAAEVAYLEGILASKLAESAAKEERKKKRHNQRPTEVVHAHPAPLRQPYAQAAPPVTEKYVSQLDPFFMLDAPDLSAGGPSQGYEVGPNQRIELDDNLEDSGYQLVHKVNNNNNNNQLVHQVVEATPTPPTPQPTYGAFPLYKGPAEQPPQIVTASPATTTKPPVDLDDSNHPTAAPRKRLVRGHSRGNWGDFELYHPGGYLPVQPSQPRKERELSKKVKKEFKAAPAASIPETKKKSLEKKERKGAKKEVINNVSSSYPTPAQQVEYNLVYRPSVAVAPSTKVRGISSSTLRGTKATKETKLRVSPSSKASTAYRGGNNPPITTYKPTVHRVKSPAARPHSAAAPSQRPNTSAAPSSKRPRTAAAAPTIVNAPAPKSSKPSTGSIRPTTSGSNFKRQKSSPPPLHPHTFFNEEQAKQVHKDWPPVYYNSIHNQQIKVSRI